jgi:cytochrome c-type biogenesis protein CcmH
MVASLAERLKQQPDDREGWLRLGNAYRVLGEREASRDALATAAARWPDDARVLEAYATAITEAAPQGSAPPDAAVLVWRRVLELEGANPSALWALGQAARAGGKADEARDYLGRLRDLLPEGSAERARVEQELDSIAGG